MHVGPRQGREEGGARVSDAPGSVCARVRAVYARVYSACIPVTGLCFSPVPAARIRFFTRCKKRVGGGLFFFCFFSACRIRIKCLARLSSCTQPMTKACCFTRWQIKLYKKKQKTPPQKIFFSKNSSNTWDSPTFLRIKKAFPDKRRNVSLPAVHK